MCSAALAGINLKCGLTNHRAERGWPHGTSHRHRAGLRVEDEIERRTLLEETYVVAMRRDHPAAEGLGLDAWLAWPHVVVSGQGEMRTPLDAHLAAIGRHRQVGLVVPSFQLVPDLLERTSLLALMPVYSLRWHSRDSLLHLEPPLPVPGFPLHLAWHSRQSTDRGLRHAISIVSAIFGKKADADDG